MCFDVECINSWTKAKGHLKFEAGKSVIHSEITLKSKIGWNTTHIERKPVLKPKYYILKTHKDK